jgi:hypothetical protein
LPPLCRVSRATKKKTQLGYKTQRTSLQSFRKFKSTAPRVYAPPGSNRSFAARSRDVPALGVSDLAAGKSSAQQTSQLTSGERGESRGDAEGLHKASGGSITLKHTVRPEERVTGHRRHLCLICLTYPREKDQTRCPSRLGPGASLDRELQSAGQQAQGSARERSWGAGRAEAGLESFGFWSAGAGLVGRDFPREMPMPRACMMLLLGLYR